VGKQLTPERLGIGDKFCFIEHWPRSSPA